MHASGLSIRRLWFITKLGMFVMLCYRTDVMGFILHCMKNKLITKSVATENILDTLIPGRFQVSSDDKRVVYVESLANHTSKQYIHSGTKKIQPISIVALGVCYQPPKGIKCDSKTKDRLLRKMVFAMRETRK